MADKVSLKTLALAKSAIKGALIGLSVAKGSPCTIKSVEDAAGGKNITFEWTASDYVTKQTQTAFFPDGEDGVSVTGATIDANRHLVISLSDGTEIDAGELPTYDGTVLYQVDSLPTTGINPDAVYLYDGKLLQHDGTKWVEVLSGGSGDGTEYEFSTEGNNLVVTDNATGVKQSLPLPTSSAGGILNDLPVGLDVGGIKKPKTYVAGTEVETILNDLLNPVMNPTLTNPSASISYSASATLPVGTTIDAKTATVSLNRGSINPQYTAAEPYRSGAATGYSLKVDGATTPFNESNTTGSFSVPALTRHLKGDITFTATASYGQGCQPKNSIGENYSTPLQAGTVSATKKISFILPFRYGATDTKDLTSLDGLETDVSVKSNKEYYFTSVNQYCVMAYDSSYGDLSLIQDQNGFNTTGSWEKHILGEYTYYVSQSRITDTNAKSTFIF